MNTHTTNSTTLEALLDQILVLEKQGKTDHEIWAQFPEAKTELADVLQTIRRVKKEASHLTPSKEFSKRLIHSLTSSTSETVSTADSTHTFTPAYSFHTAIRWLLPMGVAALLLIVGTVLFIDQNQTNQLASRRTTPDTSIPDNFTQDLAALDGDTDWDEDIDNGAALSELNTTFALLLSDSESAEPISASSAISEQQSTSAQEDVDTQGLEAEQKQLEAESFDDYMADDELNQLDDTFATI